MKEMKQTATATALDLGTIVFARRTPSYMVTVTEFANGTLTASVYAARPAGISGLGHARIGTAPYSGWCTGTMPAEVRDILNQII